MKNSRKEHPEQSEAWHQAMSDLKAIEERMRDLRAQEDKLAAARTEAQMRAHKLYNHEAYRKAFNRKFRTIKKTTRLKGGGLLTFERYEPRKAGMEAIKSTGGFA